MEDFTAKLDQLAACSGKVVAIDVETTGLRWWQDKTIGLGWYTPGNEGYIQIDRTEPGQTTQLEAIRETILTRWDLARTTVIAHNLKFDFHFLGLDPRLFERLLDTTELIHLKDSRYRKALDVAERRFLGTSTKDKHVKSHGRKKIWDWPVEDVAAYCIDDCRTTHRLAEVLLPEIKRMGILYLLREDMEYLKQLWAIERQGMLLRPEFVEYGALRLGQEIASLEAALYKQVGYEFNWRSHQQLSKAIYDDFGIEKPTNPFADADGVDRSRFAHRGKYNSTMTSTFLLQEKVNHPLAELITLLREAWKLRNVLVKWLELRDGNDRIHTNFNLTGTKTGRLSSSQPNVQNIPGSWRVRFTQTVFSGTVDRPDAYNLRKGIVAPEGHAFVSIDWRQQELRMFGMLANDPNMLPALESGQDIHSFVADQVWGSHDVFHRGMAKSITFGLVYGTSTGSLAHRLDMSIPEARKVTNQYWESFPRIQPFMREVVEYCRANCYVRNWRGRYWHEERRDKQYRSVNYLVQGGSADLLKIALLRVANYLEQHRLRTRIVSIIHDELLFEMPEQEFIHIPHICKIMEVPDLLDVPFYVDVAMGVDMGEKLEFEGKEGQLSHEQAMEQLASGWIPHLPRDDSWLEEYHQLKSEDANA